MVEKKLLSCFFLSDVLCSFRKNEKGVPMDRCFACPHHRRFVREMDEEDRQHMDEVDKVMKYGDPRKFDVPKR